MALSHLPGARKLGTSPLGSWRLGSLLLPNFRRLAHPLPTRARSSNDIKLVVDRQLLRKMLPETLCQPQRPSLSTSETGFKQASRPSSPPGGHSIASKRHFVVDGFLTQTNSSSHSERCMPLLPRCVFAPLSMGRRTHQRFVGRTGTPLGAPQQVFTTGARGVPLFTSPMAEEFHRTRPKIFRFAVTKAPPGRVAIASAPNFFFSVTPSIMQELSK